MVVCRGWDCCRYVVVVSSLRRSCVAMLTLRCYCADRGVLVHVVVCCCVLLCVVVSRCVLLRAIVW